MVTMDGLKKRSPLYFHYCYSETGLETNAVRPPALKDHIFNIRVTKDIETGIAILWKINISIIIFLGTKKTLGILTW